MSNNPYLYFYIIRNRETNIFSFIYYICEKVNMLIKMNRSD